jgi:hypothetical protein
MKRREFLWRITIRRLGQLCIQDVSTPIFFAFGNVGFGRRLGRFDGVDFVSILSCEFAGGAMATGRRIQP